MAAYHQVYANVTCGLTAKEPGSDPCQMLVIEYGTTLLYIQLYAYIDMQILLLRNLYHHSMFSLFLQARSYMYCRDTFLLTKTHTYE